MEKEEPESFTATVGSVESGLFGHMSPSERERINAMQLLMKNTKLYSYPPILTIGIIGNILAFLVLMRRSLTSSTCTYLCWLCVMDSLFLISSIGGWLFSIATGGDIRRYIDCNVYFILLLIPKHSSAWLLVAISFERLLVVYMPTKTRGIVKNVKMARVVCILINSAACVLNWVAFGGYKTITTAGQGETGIHICQGRNEDVSKYIASITLWVRPSVYSYVPSILLVICNCAIIGKLIANARSLSKIGVQPNVIVQAARQPMETTLKKHSKRLTVIALILSTTFLCLTLPCSIHFVYYRMHMKTLSGDPLQFFSQYTLHQMLAVPSVLNHAINFALYCLSGARFRRDLVRLLTCKGMPKA